MRYSLMIAGMFIVCIVGLGIMQTPTINSLFGDTSLLHIPAFFMVALLLSIAFREHHMASPVFYAKGAAVVAACVLELLQLFVPFRHATVPDMMYGVFGVAIYAACDHVVSALVQSRPVHA
jgi:VanZ family protein